MSFDTGFYSVNSEEEALAVVREEPSIIISLPENLVTDDVLFEALSRDYSCYDLIDRRTLSDNLILRLMLDNSKSIEFLPKRKIKTQHYIKMVELDGMTIQDIPPLALNSAICNAAVKANPKAHEFVPENLQDQEYVNNLLRHTPSYVNRIDISQRDTKVLEGLVEENPIILRFMTMEDRTKKICLKAMEKDYTMIQYFPEKVYEDAKVLELMSNLECFQNPTIRFDSELVRKPLAKAIFKKRPEHYRYLPMFTVDKEMAIQAIKNDPHNIYATPSHLKTDGKLWELVLQQDESLCDHIPANEQSDQVRIFITRRKAKLNNSSLAAQRMKLQKENVNEA